MTVPPPSACATVTIYPMYNPAARLSLKERSTQSFNSCGVPGSTTAMRRCSQRNRLSAGTCVLSHQGSSPMKIDSAALGMSAGKISQSQRIGGDVPADAFERDHRAHRRHLAAVDGRDGSASLLA